MGNILSYEHPYVCTDAAVFTIKTREPDSYRKLPETELRVLLYKRQDEPYYGKWCLPGGFLNIDELPEDNIRRKLCDKAEIKSCRLEQLCTFCGLDRDPRGRVVSVAYLGLMNEEEAVKFENRAVWFTVKTSPEKTLGFEDENGLMLSGDELGFDHYEIIQTALERLRSKILYTNIVFCLLPEEFTLTQLQNVYETILGKKDQAANFRRKIIDLVEETDRFTSDKGHRPAKLYKMKAGII